MCKAWHQYNERLQALALLNLPKMLLHMIWRQFFNIKWKHSGPVALQMAAVLFHSWAK